jgi:predicted phage-related endonuclease
MANDRGDFAPEIRREAIWSGDSRKVANGKMLDVVLEKQGKKELPDLSGVEAVQMGHIMQPLIGRLTQDKLGLEIRDHDVAISHPRESWFKSHFDFIDTTGKILVEAKNYNAGVRTKFDPETNRVPAADYAQLVHEAAVQGVEKIILAVLFGGQEFHTFEFTIAEQEKEDLIQKMAKVWAYCRTNTVPEAETIEQTKIVYPTDNAGIITATQQVEQVIGQLKQIKGQIKQLEELEESLEVSIRNAMAENSEIRSVDGNTLVTWKASKASKRFSGDLFKQAMPDIYEKFIVEQPGSRRFLIK